MARWKRWRTPPWCWPPPGPWARSRSCRSTISGAWWPCAGSTWASVPRPLRRTAPAVGPVRAFDGTTDAAASVRGGLLERRVLMPRPRVFRREGIILRELDYAEADRILTILTPAGKVSALAKG